ncbi:MAG: sodium:proton exchanger [Chloroflexi bacterium RBG_13_51_18]|nr:MAG: sodium:proton exchanger [Chloroflexi bacterium RBG_13_51_18]
MEGLDIGLDLLIVLVTAIAGGMLARWLRLPVILGYLAGGIAVGPFGLGLVHDSQTIETLANVGVVLLLFAIGLELSLKELFKLGKISILGGLAQIVITAFAGFWLGKLVGLGNTGSIFFGFIVALSSTMVVLKLLMERGETDTVHGRIMLGILLVQDLSVVPMMVAIPAVAGELGGLWASLGIALGKAVGFIVGMIVLGVWFMPWILKRVAGQRSRELFLLTVIVLCLAAAFGTYYMGLSAAFGAFAAGLLVSQSGYARQAFADILPLRDTFAALFFVALGLVADRNYILNHLSTIGTVAAAVILIKFVICSGITRFFGYGHKTVLMVGTGLINIGEFSFILAIMGKQAGIFSDNFYHLIVAAAIVTMFLTPFAMNLNSFLYRWLSQKPWFARQLTGRIDPDLHIQGLELSRHAVICGYGDMGKRIAGALEKQRFSYLVIDLDPTVISELRAHSIPCIYGDASNPEILAHASLDKARVLLCTIPDYVAEELTARNALSINPKLDIVARVHRERDVELLKGMGVTELVLPYFEGSLEMIRHTLHRFGMSSTDIQYVLNRLREERTVEKKGE